jgi:hypothetical protein
VEIGALKNINPSATKQHITEIECKVRDAVTTINSNAVGDVDYFFGVAGIRMCLALHSGSERSQM